MGELAAGKRDRRLTIRTISEAKDEYGGQSLTPSDLATVWGEARQLRGREFLAAAQVVAGAEIEFKIPWRNDFDETARIVFDGQEYAILNIAEIGRREGLAILAKKPS